MGERKMPAYTRMEGLEEIDFQWIPRSAVTERCVCGHHYWDHDPKDWGHAEGDTAVTCCGDFGACECEEFTYLGEEEE